MSKQFQPLADGEVVSVQNTYRVSELATQIRSKIADTLAEWSSEQGVDGEALRFGSPGWEKGKVRLRLSIEFCPSEDGAEAATPAFHQPATTTAAASAGAFASNVPANAMTSVPSPVVMPFMPTAASQLSPTTTAAAIVDDQFELGTMSDVDGEIDLNLSDDHDGYLDFDLSAAMPDLNLEELVANVQAGRPSLVEEVWSEIEQPNWPGVSRAQA